MVRRRPVFSAVLGTVAGILILASGCAEEGPTAVQLQPAKIISSGKAYSGGTYSASIGAAGGILNLPIGRIVFPAGAVDRETLITAKVDGEELAATFAPHGLLFPVGSEPRLEFVIGNANIANLQIVYLDELGNTLEVLATVTRENIATADLSHFSKYALAEAQP